MRNSTRGMLLCAIALPLLVGGCATTARSRGSEASAGSTASVALLRDRLVGTFDSSAQAAEDAAYFTISLKVVEIWKDRRDGPWLYVEQAMADQLDKPYRQRVYQLSPLGHDLYQSAVYELPGTPEEVLGFAGQWRERLPLYRLSPADLKKKDGCEVVLKWVGAEGAFKGSTLGANCESTLRGAKYATSQIVINAQRMESWDRGFDGQGVQAWGAVKGPYVFVRQAQ